MLIFLSEWASSFPTPGATPPNSPPQWIAALNAAVAAGKIPNIPASPYPAGTDPSSPQICSGSAWCKIPGDIFDGPDGYYASSFDDGPYPASALFRKFRKLLTSRTRLANHAARTVPAGSRPDYDPLYDWRKHHSEFKSVPHSLQR